MTNINFYKYSFHQRRDDPGEAHLRRRGSLPGAGMGRAAGGYAEPGADRGGPGRARGALRALGDLQHSPVARRAAGGCGEGRAGERDGHAGDQWIWAQRLWGSLPAAGKPTPLFFQIVCARSCPEPGGELFQGEAPG